MSTADAAARPSFSSTVPWYRHTTAQVVLVTIAVLVVAQIVLDGTHAYPENWYFHLADPVNRLQSWVQRNRSDNFFIAHVLRPIGDFVLWLYDHIASFLVGLPWYWLSLAIGLVILRSGRWVYALTAAGALLYLQIAGLHERGMQTLALMIICVALCVAIGGPLGIWAGLNPRVDRALRPIVDALQSLPTTLYLVLAILPFGIRQTPAAIATIAFGVPPMIRITSLGIREVPKASVEAGQIFGSSRWQLLWKVQVPQSARSFVTAINQTIMLCLSMAVIGGLIGAGGLGGELIQTLKQRSPGKGFIIGLGIFALAFAFDRLSRSLILPKKDNWLSRISPKAWWIGTAVALVLGYYLARWFGWADSPWVFDRGIASPIDDSIDWVQRNYGDSLKSFSDFVVGDVVVPLRDTMGVSLAWPVLIAIVAITGLLLRGWAFAVFCLVGLIGIGGMGMWSWGLTTLAQIIVAVLCGSVIALPIGVFIGRRGRVEAATEPILDAMQTLPSLIYAIPFVMLFRLGFVPAMMATMLFAIPAGIRLAALAVKNVPAETLEAATTFGATNRQRLWGVHLPLARSGLVLAVNQLIMLSISMAIVAGQIGENGLGYKSIEALTKPDVGIGVEAGLSLLVMAIILDRLMEGLAHRLDPTRGVAAAH